MKKTRTKIRWFKTGAYTLLLAPILTVIGINAPDYFKVQTGYIMPQYIEVGLGAILATAGGVLLLMGKTKPLKGSRGLIFATVIVILLSAIINDLVLILVALTGGSLLYSAFQPKINELQEIYKVERNAGIQATATKNVMQELEQEKATRTGRV